MASSNIPSSLAASTETDILIVGGGPVGMFAALRLGQLGQSCVLVEKSTHTTIHPKMEYTSHRSMEIYRRIGLIDQIRSRGVPESYNFNEVFTTGFGEKNYIVARIVCRPPSYKI
jgi:2-polyprenyl-6-methoxyphenol hydroxylase-like FAD-dependent oxidoreductase